MPGENKLDANQQKKALLEEYNFLQNFIPKLSKSKIYSSKDIPSFSDFNKENIDENTKKNIKKYCFPKDEKLSFQCLKDKLSDRFNALSIQVQPKSTYAYNCRVTGYLHELRLSQFPPNKLTTSSSGPPRLNYGA